MRKYIICFPFFITPNKINGLGVILRKKEKNGVAFLCGAYDWPAATIARTLAKSSAVSTPTAGTSLANST